VTIDAKAAIDSNRYADPIKTNGRWVEQTKPDPGGMNGPETMAYDYRGATANGLPGIRLPLRWMLRSRT
jgi:hypothetical protein